jgi:citrate lyase beta subunit
VSICFPAYRAAAFHYSIVWIGSKRRRSCSISARDATHESTFAVVRDGGQRAEAREERGRRRRVELCIGSARLQCLLVARALAVDPIETVTTDFRNLDALRAECLRARAAGFTAKLAIHPEQVGVINDAFQPSPAELEHARRVIAAFEAAPGSGAVALDGSMIDIVHLHAARRLLGSRKG